MKCIFCGSEKIYVGGLFFPSEPQIYGKTGHGAFIYYLCRRCFEDPNIERMVEDKIYVGEAARN